MHEIGRVELIGTTARELIARRDFCGRVLAVVTGAVYLETEACFLEAIPPPMQVLELKMWGKFANLPYVDEHIVGENGVPGNGILWLAQNHLPMHPRAVRGDFDFTPLHEEMQVVCDGTWLRFDARHRSESRVQVADAPVWTPQPVAPGQILPRKVVSERAQKLRNAIELRIPRSANALPILHVERACRDGDLPHALQAGRELVGLGPGLTPSGDDFLGALLFVAQHLHAAYPEAFEWKQQAIGDWLDWAHPRTNSISYSILRDHASGKSVEPLHNLVGALLQGKASDEMTAHVRALLAIGSTSGWDMLLGVMTGMLLIESTPHPFRTSKAAAPVSVL